MTESAYQARPYPRSHILAASGVAAVLSLALLVFPSREVEAKRSHLGLDISAGQIRSSELPDSEPAATLASPFALSRGTAPATDLARFRTLKVAQGDTLSTLFSQAGLSSTALHQVLESSKDARQLTRLRVGQELRFEFEVAVFALNADGADSAERALQALVWSGRGAASTGVLPALLALMKV